MDGTIGAGGYELTTENKVITGLCVAAMFASLYGHYSGNLIPLQIIVGILVVPLALAGAVLALFAVFAAALHMLSTVYAVMSPPRNQQFKQFARDFNFALDPGLLVICVVILGGIYYILSLVELL